MMRWFFCEEVSPKRAAKEAIEELDSAIINNKVLDVNRLIKAGVKLNKCSKRGRSAPLHTATLIGHLAFLSLLLSQQGVDVNIPAQDDLNTLPLNLAVSAENYSMTFLLFLKGAKFETLKRNEEKISTTLDKKFAEFLRQLEKLSLLEKKANSHLENSELKAAQTEYISLIKSYENLRLDYQKKFQEEHEFFLKKFQHTGENFCIKAILHKIEEIEKKEKQCDAALSNERKEIENKKHRSHSNKIPFFPDLHSTTRSSDDAQNKENFLVSQYM